MKNKPTRGFKSLIGQTIKKIDASSINVVHFELANGMKFSIQAEEFNYGIPVIACDDYWVESDGIN